MIEADVCNQYWIFAINNKPALDNRAGLLFIASANAIQNDHRMIGLPLKRVRLFVFHQVFSAFAQFLF